MFAIPAAKINHPWTNCPFAHPFGRRPCSLRAVLTGVGLDLLEIDRLAVALARRPRLAERLFTDAERAFATERGEPARHLAARFCAKEAVAKALALRDGDWHDVEVLGGGDGAPGVRLSGRAAARAAELGVEVAISLTHSKGMAGAVAMLK
jgi:holo-[acyl-carrier protein] synthase